MDDMIEMDETAENQFTKSIEEYTAAIPSSAYLGVALGAMALSLVCQATGRGKWGNFIAQWVPTWLIIGVYNKLVKLEGHDRASAKMTEQPGEHICEFCDSKFSFEDDPPKSSKALSIAPASRARCRLNRQRRYPKQEFSHDIRG